MGLKISEDSNNMKSGLGSALIKQHKHIKEPASEKSDLLSSSLSASASFSVTKTFRDSTFRIYFHPRFLHLLGEHNKIHTAMFH